MPTYIPFTYSEGGAARAVLTRKVWDRLLHQKVQNKIFFKRFIGQDTGKEGNIYESQTAMPIVLKNELERQPGDLITMQMIKNISNDAASSGVVGTETMVGSEEELTFGYMKVQIDLTRKAVLILGTMSFQRTPIQLMNEAIDQLSDSGAQLIDNNLFKALYAGHSYNLARSLGLTAVPLTNHPNIFFGNLTNTLLSQLDNTMHFDTTFLENTRTWLIQNNINPVMVDGSPKWIWIVDPTQAQSLRQSPNWFAAMQQAMERGKTNPIFQNALGEWAGQIIFESNKVEQVKDYTLATIAAGTYGNIVSETACQTFNGSDARFDALNSGVTAARVHGAILLGAHSVGWAYGRQWQQVRRKEDDYEEKYGFGIRSIFGMKRADWVDVDAATTFNQAGAVAYTYD